MDVLSNSCMESSTSDESKLLKENTTLNGCTGIKEENGKIKDPFSALTTSMWPQTIDVNLSEEEEENSGEEERYKYDEFGFRITDGRKRGESLVENESHRLQWLAHLEFTYSRSLDGDLSWEGLERKILPSGKLKLMIREEGIPHSLRPQLWMRMSGALERRYQASIGNNSSNGNGTNYRDVVATTAADHTANARQIEKDLVRMLPSNACFSHISSTGIPRLRRILRGLAWLYPDIGYCQGMGVVVAHLLLLLEEEDVFWLMCILIEDLLPASYYSTNLIGVQADQRVLRELISRYLPALDQLLNEHDIEISLITLHWFLTVFASVVNIRHLLRLWDIFFCEGSTFMFKIILGMMKLRETELIGYTNTAQIFNCLSKIPSEIDDINLLIKTAYNLAGDLDVTEVQTLRKRSLADIMTSEGHLVDPNHNLPKQRINKRQLTRSRSLISQLLWHGSSIQGNESAEAAKIKNVRQTEMLVDLRNSILQIIRHFECGDDSNTGVPCIAAAATTTTSRTDHDEQNATTQQLCNYMTEQLPRYSTQPDYSLQSHAEDLERYVQVARNRHKRAKAIMDFERHDEDELGFRKNDVITIISMKDEHCWIGEINGLRGWFPAKLVELLDERSKDYCWRGDDSVDERVADLVRGVVCPSIKAILEHGIKKSRLLDTKCHPWLFIEEAASREVEKDFHSIYSRLTLCKTFRLDEDGKVLTPEELLFKAIQTVNCSHDAAHAQMDVKLRSLICCGLNEQVLHLWLETLCSSSEVVKKWYQPWSFIRSPGWVQIKCELRLLCQLSFMLHVDYELYSSVAHNGRNELPGLLRNSHLNDNNSTIITDNSNNNSNSSSHNHISSADPYSEYRQSRSQMTSINHHVNNKVNNSDYRNCNHETIMTQQNTNTVCQPRINYHADNNYHKYTSHVTSPEWQIQKNVREMLVKYHLFSWELN